MNCRELRLGTLMGLEVKECIQNFGGETALTSKPRKRLKDNTESDISQVMTTGNRKGLDCEYWETLF